ncbi:MAG: 50S ribosomal protein L31e [Nanoarchaeota archaeon]
MATERSYNVPLRTGFMNTPRWKRTKKAITILREFLIQHTKREDVKIGMHLNERIWKHGGKNPPHHIKVDVWIEDDHAKAELSGYVFKEAVKAKKKEGPKTLKDKLAKKLGVDEKEEKKTEEIKQEEPAKKEEPAETIPETAQKEEIPTKEPAKKATEPKKSKKAPAKTPKKAKPKTDPE